MTAEDREIARTAPAWWTGADIQDARALWQGCQAACDSLRTALAAERVRADAAERRIEQLEKALQVLRNWADAYPLSVFPEPDFKRAHEVLTTAGMSIDSISASNMRHVITRVKRIIDATTEGVQHGEAK